MTEHLFVVCKRCGAGFDMDYDPPLSDTHMYQDSGVMCTASETDWDLIVTEVDDEW